MVFELKLGPAGDGDRRYFCKSIRLRFGTFE